MSGIAAVRDGAARAFRPTFEGDDAGRKNMLLIVQLRWIAVAGQVVTIAVVGLGFGAALPFATMGLVLLAQVAVNLASLYWVQRRDRVTAPALLLVLVFDVAALTAQLYMSGGGANPFVALYLLQVALAALLLEARFAWLIVAVATACYIGLTLEYEPLQVPGRSDYELFRLHSLGLLTCFLLMAGLLVVFLTRIAANLRERDARIAALRQSAAEEDHIVRMGLLASGAAHELGTPLSSLSVALGDWERMPEFANDPDRAQEIAEMQAEVKRCKSIVTGILMSAGDIRGEAPRVTSAREFLDALVADWRTGRGTVSLNYSNRFEPDLPIVSDEALKQVVTNVLDNALEASPRYVELTADRAQDALLITVADRGPGFAPGMLAEFGRPYQSTKGRTGGGLGLFLVVNVLRKLGGSATAQNRPSGGAVVTIRLPLDVLSLERRDDR
ncbi:ATP-binding protein [Acuticoccus sp. I52.16.1]|uniref:ATP-binding protein n=1 Tax=Acuticoccus sp. I52.16.1 TaxID=2928472 RepID=UPI001FD5D28F|nr:ATP-binding protein [Acuticoccus sp. I52.16.1]UOM35346.1 ATP-binding protein [Acuticoccus sp. I52.16.1]